MYQLWPLSLLYLEHLLKHHEKHQVKEAAYNGDFLMDTVVIFLA